MQLKTRAIVTPITLVMLLGILSFGAWWGYKKITDPLPGNIPTPCLSVAAKELTSDKVAVRVFNGGFSTGLGAKVGKTLTSKGFHVLLTGNTKVRVKKTIIVASSVDAPEAKLVSGLFKNAVINADSRVDGTVDVLVGSEYGGIDSKAPTSTTLKTGNACVPVLSSTNPSAHPTS